MAFTNTNVVTLKDGRRYNLDMHGDLARIDRHNDPAGSSRTTVARLYNKPGIGWIHKESGRFNRSFIDLSLQLIKEGVV